MYTLYLDESGDWGYPNFHVKYPVFCLCGCIIHKCYYNKVLLPGIKHIKRNKFHKDIVFHRYKVQQKTNDFRSLKTKENVDTFVKEFSTFIASTDITLLISAINKAEHYSTYGSKRVDSYLPVDIYHMVFTFTIERFVLFLKEKVKGKIVVESRGRKEDQSVQYWYSLILRNGTQFIRDWQFRKVLPPTIEFRLKSENIIGLQLADWIAYSMSKKIHFPDGREDKYGEWELYKKKIWIGTQAPARGQIGFKVFPKNIGRVLLNMPIKSAKDST